MLDGFFKKSNRNRFGTGFLVNNIWLLQEPGNFKVAWNRQHQGEKKNLQYFRNNQLGYWELNLRLFRKSTALLNSRAFWQEDSISYSIPKFLNHADSEKMFKLCFNPVSKHHRATLAREESRCTEEFRFFCRANTESWLEVPAVFPNIKS